MSNTQESMRGIVLVLGVAGGLMLTVVQLGGMVSLVAVLLSHLIAQHPL